LTCRLSGQFPTANIRAGFISRLASVENQGYHFDNEIPIVG
jgi:hypothetical protein